MKLVIKNIEATSFESADMFSGAYEVTGMYVTAIVTDCPKPQMFGICQADFVAEEGKEVCFFLKNMVTPQEALWYVQQVVDTDQPAVVKSVQSTWTALDQYGRKVECDDEEEALFHHKRFGEPSRTDVVTFA